MAGRGGRWLPPGQPRRGPRPHDRRRRPRARAPHGELDREQKQEFVRRLDELGAFTLRRSVEDVAEVLGVSRFHRLQLPERAPAEPLSARPLPGGPPGATIGHGRSPWCSSSRGPSRSRSSRPTRSRCPRRCRRSSPAGGARCPRSAASTAPSRGAPPARYAARSTPPTTHSSLREELLTADAQSDRFTYRLTEVEGALKLLFASVDGSWAFQPVGTGTRDVTWSWTIHPASDVASFVLPVVGVLWKGYARRALDRLDAMMVADLA